ncbi:class I SAM-dependent methyltransferase [Dyadobacter pollutisoli]|uniref:Class I SAM-dependent methyltransferase n=1 Tax=Dyadobacter pollutisoli TaxID=2910158 RepID=A0A9E8NDE7_9BACT|nr:class I SAM-dependent methyltransferase [Dyadobacter pollutisoli]WAC12174.1 class I SAM-dependent methyltransferase [Dyadobacter pollutisoli]
MTNNYDQIAGSYDMLSRLVFRKSIVHSQQVLLPFLNVPSRLLIVGGGTGWILEELAKIHASGFTVTYVEISCKMIDLAKKRDFKQNQVSFIHTAIEDFESNEQFDAVMTPFLFDNFGSERAARVFTILDRQLVEDGMWLFTDFHIDKKINGTWQKILLKSMYLFFKILSHVEASRLPEMEPLFNDGGYAVMHKSYHFRGFIQSVVYRKIRSAQPASDQK